MLSACWFDTTVQVPGAGLTVTIGVPAVTAINYDRQVKGDQVVFVVTGVFLTTAQKIKVIDSSSSCGGNDAANIITGGGGTALTTITGATSGATGASLTLTLDEAHAGAKFCFYSATTEGSAATSYLAPTGNDEVVTVIDITRIAASTIEVAGSHVNDATTYQPNHVSGNTVAMFTLTTPTVTLTVNDKIKFIKAATSDCSGGDAGTGIVTGGGGQVIIATSLSATVAKTSDYSLTSAVAAATGATEVLKLCLLAGSGGGATAWPNYHLVRVGLFFGCYRGFRTPSSRGRPS